MRRSIVLLLFVLAAPSLLLAAEPAVPDFICVTADPTGCSWCADAPAFQTTTLFLILLHPSQPVASVSGWLRIETTVAYFGDWEVDVYWTNAATLPVFDLTPVGGPQSGDVLLLADIPLTPIAMDDQIEFHVEPADPEGSVFYRTPTGEEVALDYWSPSQVLNPTGFDCIFDRNESHAWSAVKAMYR